MKKIFISILMSCVGVISLAYAFQNAQSGDSKQIVVAQKTKKKEGKTTEKEEQRKITAQQYDSWFYRCVTNSKTKKTESCEIVQIAQAKRGEKLIPLLTVSLSEIAVKETKRPVITVVAPLDVHLPTGFGLKVDEGKTIGLRYRNCNQAGCWIQTLLTDEIIASLQKGNYGYGRIKLLNGKNVNIKFSLKGLSSAYAAMKSGQLPKGSS